MAAMKIVELLYQGMACGVTLHVTENSVLFARKLVQEIDSDMRLK